MVLGSDTLNVDFELVRGWSILGFIRNDSLQPLGGVDLDVYTTNGVRMDVDTSSLSSGGFTLGPFRPGAYIIRANPSLASE